MRLIQIGALRDEDAECLMRELAVYSPKRSRCSILIELDERSHTDLMALLAGRDIPRGQQHPHRAGGARQPPLHAGASVVAEVRLQPPLEFATTRSVMRLKETGARAASPLAEGT
jgi:hypothetical protein